MLLRKDLLRCTYYTLAPKSAGRFALPIYVSRSKFNSDTDLVLWHCDWLLKDDPRDWLEQRRCGEGAEVSPVVLLVIYEHSDNRLDDDTLTSIYQHLPEFTSIYQHLPAWRWFYLTVTASAASVRVRTYDARSRTRTYLVEHRVDRSRQTWPPRRCGAAPLPASRSSSSAPGAPWPSLQTK